MNPLILIVEDEPPQAELLKYNLEKAGFQTMTAGDGELALAMVQEEDPDLILLDWMLPEISGIDICRRLRAHQTTKAIPIIMLTARGEEGDRVLGLDVGADDYIVKPYSPKEMVSRVKAMLRRVDITRTTNVLEFGDLTMDLNSHKVSRAQLGVHLGPKEFKLLQILMERPTKVFTRETLLDQAWGKDIYVEDRTVDVHIARLRKALNKDTEKDLIRTVRGVGYSLDA
jgi:two-component system, OmpR family, phosphate regulon response regulator PhoB